MTERPMLFSAPMVKAILAGRKTQTRRAVKPALVAPQEVRWSDHNPGWWIVHNDADNKWSRLRSPYGQPGDRLWARETWQYAGWTEDGYPFVGYRADGSNVCIDRDIPEEWAERLTDIWAGLSSDENVRIDGRAADRKWRPAIHMPRWACRVVLEVVGVRVERLQDISDRGASNDCTEEGVFHAGRDLPSDWQERGFRSIEKCAYRDLWESINGAGSWDANPWVWVVEFKPQPNKGERHE